MAALVSRAALGSLAQPGELTTANSGFRVDSVKKRSKEKTQSGLKANRKALVKGRGVGAPRAF